ncbi:hypothetical protein KUTeg_018189 [Tegillarca granosa]|uniref:Laminin G domain-containing protein n=1 Tax=Tegillarca granosa TaxID=220873 RepID=A0ABQ9EJL5_TEGGR|nr:hypothetical protein KUTeg_018189 [Tegillarca granosa]
MAFCCTTVAIIAVFMCMQCIHAASFYGNSYINIPFQDASSTTQLELRFKTTRPHGMLFLALGDTDFLIVELNGGILEIRLDLGSGEVVLNSPQSISLDDHTWHVMRLRRNKADVELYVDGRKLDSKVASGSFHDLNIQNGIYLGGIGNADVTTFENVKNFRGCLSNVIFNQYDILYAARQINNPGSVQKISWDCNEQFNVESSEPIGYLTETSYTAFQHLPITTQGVIAFEIKTKSSTAMLMFCTGTQSSAHSDLFAVEIIQGNLYGFHEIQISSEVEPGCPWNYPCAANPCKTGAQCVERGDNFECICDSGNCVRVVEEAPDGHTGENDGEDVQLVAINKLEIEEGARKVISSDNIEVLFDHRRYRVRESAIHFHVLESPQHGRIEVVVGRKRNTNVFTLLDLMGNRVFYIHDGSETYTDDVTIEINIAINNGGTIPERLTQRYDFVLPIIVIPVNDPPVLMISNGYIQMVRNTKLGITKNILNVEDPDNEPSDLVYTSMCPEDKGYFERSNDVGQPINTFTQLDVNQKQILFVHQDGTNAQCRIQVRDQEASFGPITFRIRALQLRLQLPKNTGIELFIGTSVVIQKENLTVVTNAPSQELDIRYEITQPPKYGEVQRQQQSDQAWISVSNFAQRHINNGQVRYIHKNVSSPVFDQFAFIVSSLDQRISQHIFSIYLKSTVIEVMAPHFINLEMTDFKRFSPNDLNVQSNNPNLSPTDVRYILIRPPFQGNIYKMYPEKSITETFAELNPLGKDWYFTQKDIDDGLIVYKLKHQTYENIDDFMVLKVTTVGAQPVIKRLDINYVPEETDVRFVNNGLDNVIEGGQKTIERRNLYLEMKEYRDFEFSVTDLPEHGQLQLIDPRSGVVKKSNISRFSNRDIQDLKLVYKHDDTESDKDSFMFVASPVISSRNQLPVNIPEITGTLDIRMLMRNDNPPVRLVDKVFNVVINKERTLTLDDLAFTDPDIDYDPMDLLYKRRGISTGKIIYTHNKSEAFDFTQRDIANGNIAYQHSGSELFGRAVIWVSDGQFYTTSLFEIAASNPYVKVINNTGILARVGASTTISSYNLSIETNVDIDPDHIRFVLIEEPLQGQLKVNGLRVTEFTYSSVIQGLLSYEHKGLGSLEDMFKYAVVAGSVQVQGQFPIRVIFESQNRPPRVVHNNVLEVSESGSAVLTESHLLVTHPDSLPSGIVYTVRMAPKHGQLFVVGSSTENGNYQTFTQDDINRGHVKYHHSDFNPSDMFFFDVSNGMQYLKGLEFVIEIIPANLQLQIQNFTVREGGRRSLIPSILHLNGRYLEGKSVTYFIIKQPSHGILENVRQVGVPLSQFTSEDLHQGNIRFVHDNSESNSDQFSVKARVESMESPVKKVYVAVDTINDQPPRIVINTGITLWKGSLKRITQDMLKAVDQDSSVDRIMFTVTSPTNGHIAFLNNTFKEISSFTQDQINRGLIVFVHQGAATGQFKFHTSDGVNSDVLRVFHVTAKPLVLSLVNNEPLKIYPGKSQPITNLHLLARTNDINQTRTVIYNIETKPKKGRIVTMFQGQTREIQSFRQDEINDGQIFYTHTSYPDSWSETDLFHFEVSTLYAEPLKESFEIDISYGNRKSLVDTEDVVVNEGGEVTITRQNLDVTGYIRELEKSGKRAIVKYVLDSLPHHGKLSLRNRFLEHGDEFTQDSINRGQLRYTHDDSDTNSDSFTFSLSVDILEQTHENPDAQEVEFTSTFNITVRPVNDERFTLITTNPSMNVVEGLAAEITSDVLKTVDKDTPPNGILYEIIVQPTNGILALTDNLKVRIQQFTQNDIDEKRVVFINDGSGKSGKFQFRVSDGAFDYVYKYFIINIVQISVDMVKNNNIQLLQGDSSVYIGRDILDTRTNGIRSNITFNVTQVPKYGNLYIGRNVVTQFRQTHLDNSQLLYIQSDMSSDMDYFICSIFHMGSNQILRNKRVNVIVSPLVQQNPVDASMSGTVYISTKFLDASKLANLTRDVPKFNILLKPKFGRIIKKGLRQTRAINDDRDDVEVDRFTHEDIRLSKILYVKNEDSLHRKGTDSFAYVLTARAVQPARGMMHIKLSPDAVITTPRTRSRLTPLYPTEDDDSYSVENDGASDKDKAALPKSPHHSEVVNPNVRNDFIIILAILIPLFILVIIVLIVVYFLWKRQRYRDYTPPDGNKPRLRPEISGPVPLDQPHVHIEPKEETTDSDEEERRLEYAHHNYYNVPLRNISKGEYENSELSPSEDRDSLLGATAAEISYTIPECKVTALENNEDRGRHSPAPSSDSVNLFDWTLMDPELLEHCKTNTSAPVLRDNQYWV